MIGIIKEGKKVLCDECKTKKYRSITIDNQEDEDFGIIVVHKKDCPYVKSLKENSVEV